MVASQRSPFLLQGVLSILAPAFGPSTQRYVFPAWGSDCSFAPSGEQTLPPRETVNNQAERSETTEVPADRFRRRKRRTCQVAVRLAWPLPAGGTTGGEEKPPGCARPRTLRRPAAELGFVG